MPRCYSRRAVLRALAGGTVSALLISCRGRSPALSTPTANMAAGATTPVVGTAGQATTGGQGSSSTGGLLTGGSSLLPVNLPREQVLVLAQIVRYSRVNNYNLFVPGALVTPTRQGLIFDTLWYIDQQTGEWINSLAADKPTYNQAFTEMTVRLRPGVFWSDGVEFTADDVVFTVNTLKANSGLIWSADLNRYCKSAEALDSHTVRFTLADPNPRFHYLFTANYQAVWIMAKHVWEKAGDLKSFAHFPPVSLGAYVYAQSDPNGFWELYKRRDDWQRTTPGMIVGRAGPEYIMTIFQGSDTKDVLAMSRGAQDVIFDVNYEAFNSLISTTQTARSWYKDFPWAYQNELNVRYFGFNQARKPFDNKEVRWALALALDIVELQTRYEGGIPRVTPFLVPATPFSMKIYHLPLEDWLRSFQLDLGNGQTFAPYDPDVPSKIAQWAKGQGYAVPSSADELHQTFGIGWWKYAPDVAEQLLKKNGFTKDAQGKWHLPDGNPWKFSIIAATDEVDAYRLALGAQDQWRKFGIDVQVEGLQRDLWSNRRSSGDFDCSSDWHSLMQYANADLWPSLRTWHSRTFAPIGTAIESTGTNNIVRYKSDALDKLIDSLASTSPDASQALTLGQEALKLWVQDMITLPTVSFKKFITFNQAYWSNWPTVENPYRSPTYWFMHGRFTLQSVQRKA